MTDNIITLSIGEIPIEIHSELELNFSSTNQTFLSDNTSEGVSIQVHFIDKMPDCRGRRYGSDMLFYYYYDEHYNYMQARKGTHGSVSLAVYTSNFTKCNLYINESAFPNTVRTLDKVLQLLPIRQLLSYYDILMLHSSRIRVDKKAILFTAPSQTGKTTQAQLWKHYENTEIVSNDRSLIRNIHEDYVTYGYPVDGSDPTYNNQQISLGAIVVLQQNNQNEIQPLSVTNAFKCLMAQTAMDSWDSEQRTIAMRLWLDIINRYPIYLLKCRPDKESVYCLKQQLLKDKVI